MALVFSKLTLHMVQFGPYNWVNLAPKMGAKNRPFGKKLVIEIQGFRPVQANVYEF